MNQAEIHDNVKTEKLQLKNVILSNKVTLSMCTLKTENGSLLQKQRQLSKSYLFKLNKIQKVL